MCSLLFLKLKFPKKKKGCGVHLYVHHYQEKNISCVTNDIFKFFKILWLEFIHHCQFLVKRPFNFTYCFLGLSVTSNLAFGYIACDLLVDYYSVIPSRICHLSIEKTIIHIDSYFWHSVQLDFKYTASLAVLPWRSSEALMRPVAIDISP